MYKLQNHFILILFSFLLITGSIGYAQQPEYYRYVHGEKVAMKAIENEYMIIYEENPDRPAELAVQANYAEKKSRFTMKDKQHERYTVRSQNFFEAVKQDYPFAHISPVFLNEDNREQFASNEIMVVWSNLPVPVITPTVANSKFTLQMFSGSQTWFLAH